ncbi:transcription factor HRS1-like [Andrographis paniculata]|uniref:transcription factor HRS1-like n=1 Tax=Andrographis paniculata TaxID=175694 RepID=UPI0021E80FDF|nr:transcription factor HRS1-like [Andrographis paniculata]
MMINSHNHPDFSQEMQTCRDYIQALEIERRKIQVFQRELPLSLELVQQAIEACKQQLSGTAVECNLRGQSECSDQTTSSYVPVFEEFFPIKRASFHSDGEEHQSVHDKLNEDDDDAGSDDGKIGRDDKNPMKSDWLRSAQLWNQTQPNASDPSLNEESTQRLDATRNDSNALPASGACATCTEEQGGSGGGGGGGGIKKSDGKDSQANNRKIRRCWSPELHRRFLQALKELGGSHVATPKQIREHMKVDGLTNDEVKSHLQKYRLHTRRPSPTIQPAAAGQAPQFVVVGGIWVPPEYAATVAAGEAAASTAAPPTGIYAPIATLPRPASLKQHNPIMSDGGGSAAGVRSNSPATSSSTHMTAATATSQDY